MMIRKVKALCIAIVALLAFETPATAQSFDWGIVGGMNFTKLQFQGPDKHEFNSDQKCGWYIGPKFAFNTVIGLGVDASAQFSQRDLSINGETEHYRTIELPINLRYNIGMGKKLGAYISTGPQFGFSLNNMSWDRFGSGSNFDRQNMVTTWNIGAGIRLLNHFELGIGYNMSLSRTGEAILGNIAGDQYVGQNDDYVLKYRHNTVQVQLTYWF